MAELESRLAFQILMTQIAVALFVFEPVDWWKNRSNHVADWWLVIEIIRRWIKLYSIGMNRPLTRVSLYRISHRDYPEHAVIMATQWN